ncbi:MAG: dockerin type I domain-containing protein [Candidatus Peribacteraceae bacterium]|nr:dockerin type I domain-containing protein [Candidatus Peribacteraceae bacterium]
MRNTAKRFATVVAAFLLASEVFAPLAVNAQTYAPVRSPVQKEADLATNIKASVTAVTPGMKNIQVIFKMGNNGPSATTKSTMRVTLPQGITVQTPPATRECKVIGQIVECTSGPIKPNAAANYSMTLQALPTLKCPQSVKLGATIVASSHPDRITSNNAMSQLLSVSCVEQPKIDISFDGPVTQTYKPGTKDVVFANVKMEASTGISVNQGVLVVQGFAALKNLPKGGIAMIDTFVQNLEIRNTVTGQTVPARLYQRVSTSDGQFGLYRVNNFMLKKGMNQWEIRGDFTLNTRDGDKFRAGTCTTAAGSSDPLCKFSSSIPSSTSHSLIASTLNGQRVTSVRPGGVMTGSYQLVGVPTLAVTQKATVPNDTATANQKNINLLKFEARANEVEDVLLTDLSFRNSDGDLTNVVNYTLWVDINADGAVDPILQKGAVAANGFVTFDKLTGGGYVVPKSGSSAVFEVHGDVASSLSPKTFQLAFATPQPTTYVEAEAVSDGTPLLGITTDGTCRTENGYPTCQTVVVTGQATRWTFVSVGNLFVTKSSTPIRERQLLGGTLGDEILRLQFRADLEDIDVTDIVLTATDTNAAQIAQNVDRLELYKAGATTPFATATIGGCGTDQVPANSFCAKMTNQQLVVPEESTVNVLVRPRMRTDTDGAVSGQFVKIMVDDASGTTIRARGLASSNALLLNDGDAALEGEVFIGTDSAGQNREITGNKNVVVLSKVVSITNVNPDPNGTQVPAGVAPVGQFKFSAAANNNLKNGPNKFTLTDVIFDIDATNVAFGSGGFKLYNKADPTVKARCYDLEGTSDQHHFWVACWDAGNSGVTTAIDSGTDATFVLEADITNPAISRTETSSLVVSLTKFNDPSLMGMSSSLSHIRWLDKDNGLSVGEFWWIEYPETVVRSTQYVGASVSEADLSLFKTGPDSVMSGTGLTYTVSLKNSGPSTAENVVVRDTFTAGLEYVGSSAGSACSASGNTVLCTVGSFPTTQRMLIKLHFNVPETMACGSGSTLRNVASVSSSTLDPNIVNNSNATSPVLTNVQCPPRQLGDVNGNGIIGGMDASYIGQYLLPETDPSHRNLSAEELEAADVNQDGRVSKADERVLGFRVVGCIKTLPWAFADTNLDGTIDAADLAIVKSFLGRTDVNTVSEGCTDGVTKSITMSDVNEDAKITLADYYLMDATIKGVIAALPQLYGDVSGNGSVTAFDGSKISRYAADLEQPTPQQRFLADLNADMTIDAKDVTLIGELAIGRLHQSDMPVLCGNSQLNNQDPATEQCDDGNTTNGDGCSATCLVEERLALQSAAVADGKITIVFSKNFATCASIYTKTGKFDQRINFLCAKGDNRTATANLRELGRILDIGEEIKLCHGNNGNICSGFVTIQGAVPSSSSSFSSSSLPPLPLPPPPSSSSSSSSSSSLPPPSPPPSSPRSLGDVDNDGDIDRTDYEMIEKHINGIAMIPTDDLPFADVERAKGVRVPTITKADYYLVRMQTEGCAIPLPKVIGDADEGGVQSAADAFLISQHIAGMTVPPFLPFPAWKVCLVDANVDHKVDAKDPMIVENSGLGKDPAPVTCGNGIVENGTNDEPNWGEQCDDRNTVNGDGCSATCKTEVAVAQLSIVQKAIGSTNTAVANQKNINLLRFESRAQHEEVLLTEMTFDAGQGTVVNAVNYTLWVDTDSNGAVDTILKQGVGSEYGKVTFVDLAGGGYVIPTTSAVIMEVHADVASGLLSGTEATFRLKFATLQSGYVQAETVDNGEVLSGIKTGGVCAGTCQISVTTVPSTLWTFVPAGNLYVTKSSTPTRSRQLLGGTLGEEALRLTFRADAESVDVTAIRISTSLASRSIDQVELYRAGDSTPFGVATIGGCAGWNPGATDSFCVILQSRQLVVPAGAQVEVIARPRIKSDMVGGVSGDSFKLRLLSQVVTVEARGDISSNALAVNDGDAVAEGEVFVGTSVPAANSEIIGSFQQVVMSKVTSITNADPNANGTAIPTGAHRDIGAFKFDAAANSNGKYGPNVIHFDSILFTVNAVNVDLAAEEFKIYDKENGPTQFERCIPYVNGTSVTTGTVTGTIQLDCGIGDYSPVNNTISSGQSKTFGILADVTGTQGAGSALQISLNNFTDPLHTRYFFSDSHISWFDKDVATATDIFWVDMPETVVNGTAYAN